MMSLYNDKQALLTLHLDIWMVFSTFIIYVFNNIVSQVYPSELQLNKANTSDTKASNEIYDKRDDFDFELSISHF